MLVRSIGEQLMAYQPDHCGGWAWRVCRRRAASKFRTDKAKTDQCEERQSVYQTAKLERVMVEDWEAMKTISFA